MENLTHAFCTIYKLSLSSFKMAGYHNKQCYIRLKNCIGLVWPLKLNNLYVNEVNAV